LGLAFPSSASAKSRFRKRIAMRVFIPPGNPADGSAYLAEILLAGGLSFTERCSLRDALKAVDPHRDLILLPHGSEARGIEPFVHAGGNVVAIRPDPSVERLAGLSRQKEADGPSSLRLVQPVCFGARGEPLWTLGQVTVFENDPGPDVAGYLFRPGELESEAPGIIERAIGAGRLVIYAYDPAQCIAQLRQGRPERAGQLPPGETRPRSLYLQEPNPPADTLWRPTADLHCMGLCAIIKGLLARHAPVPTLWHIPAGHPAILLFSGDEDAGEQAANERQMKALESAGGAMSLYVFPDHTSVTHQRIEEYTRRGHTISVHPNLVPAAGRPVAEQLARAEKQVRLFQEKFQRPVHTVRNHSYGWPGYLELPSLWERLGIGLDANTCAFLFRQSLDGGPFANVHAALPLPFVREDGSLIDVYQQPTHISDDIWFHPTVAHSMKYSAGQFDGIAHRILDDAVRFYHSPICANFHPCNYVDFSGEHGRMLIRRALELDVPIWSLDRWHDFWRARATWRLTHHEWDGAHLRFVLQGAACESLCLILPSVFARCTLQEITLAGVSTPIEPIERQGQFIVPAVLPAGLSDVEGIAKYSADNINGLPVSRCRKF